MTNPLHVIEQLIYLMFIRSLDENDIQIEEFENAGVKADIVANAYDLSISKYKKIEYVATSYPPPAEILGDVAALEKKIPSGISELKKYVERGP